MITSPITRPITSRIASAIAGARVGGAANPLVWHAATPDSDGVMQAQLIGSGTPSFTVDDGLLLPDHEGVYVAISEDTPPWHGARWVDGVAYGTDGSGDPLDPLPSLYGAPSYTNSLTYSNDLTNAAWTKVNSMEAALDAAGLTGSPSSASTVTDSGGTNQSTYRIVTILDDSATHTFRYFVAKDSDETRFPELSFTLSGGTSQNINIGLNTKTGAYVTRTSTGTVGVEVNSNGGFWEILLSISNNSTGNTSALPGISPAYGSTIGVNSPAATGSIIVGNVELHLNKTIAQVRGSAPIITAASTVTTTAISMSYDIANHSDTQGAYYCEWTPYYNNAEFSAANRAILTLNNGISYGPFSYVATQSTFDMSDSDYDASSVSVSAVSGTTNKLGAAYGDGSHVINVDGTEDATPGTYSGHFPTYPTSYNGIWLNNNHVAPVLIRNIRRYNLSYTTAKAKITELMS